MAQQPVIVQNSGTSGAADPRRVVGLRRYLYEHVFYDTINQVSAEGTLVTSTRARMLRQQLADHLQRSGVTIEDPNLSPRPVLEGIDSVLGRELPGYTPRFTQGTSSPAYQQPLREFMVAAGMEPTTPSGSAGRRILISPYDPTFSGRQTVRESGTRQLYVDNATLEALQSAYGDRYLSQLPEMDGEADVFFRHEPDGTTSEAGLMLTRLDKVGLTSLSRFMSDRELQEVSAHLTSGFVDASGEVNSALRMSPAAVARSEALLQQMSDEGIDFSIQPDMSPGQIKAVLEGTNIEVRLTDTAPNEHMVGRIYDDGAVYRFSTSVNDSAEGAQRRANYTPTAQEAFDLLRIAMGQQVVGPSGIEVGRPGQLQLPGVSVPVESSYYSSGAHVMTYAPLEGVTGGHVQVRREGTYRTERSMFFSEPDKARGHLAAAVGSAREVLTEQIAVEELVASYGEQVEQGSVAPEDFEPPTFSGDSAVASLQRSYWDVLTGRQQTLARPDVDAQEYLALLAAGDERAVEMELHGESVEMVRQHAALYVDHEVGRFDLVTDPQTGEITGVSPQDGPLFNPIGTARYMESDSGQWANTNNLVVAAKAAGIEPDRLRGQGFAHRRVLDSMISFDESTAVPLEQIDTPVRRHAAETAKEAAELSGLRDVEVQMDAQGVMRWTGQRATARTTIIQSGKDKGQRRSLTEVTGEIGQVFEPGERGEVTTQFAGGENYLFVPGYTATVVEQQPGEEKSLEERTRLRGYTQAIGDMVRYRVASSTLSSRRTLSDPTALNGVYSNLYTTRHEVDFLTNSVERGMEPSLRDAILATEARRVSYPKRFARESTIGAEFHNSQANPDADPGNDNFASSWRLTGGRNMAVMTADSDGWFDPAMTSGGTNQGIVRYLTEGARVSPEGVIVPSSDPDDRAPLAKLPELATMRFDARSRQTMTYGNLMRARWMSEPVTTGMFTLQGWNQNDAMVISKEFAESYPITPRGHEARPLQPGDKLTDPHGNKGVVSLVVDPDMDLEQARAEQVEDVVEVFRRNPKLSVVVSPFSSIGRANGGTSRDLLENPSDLHLDGEVVPGGLGGMRFVAIAGTEAEIKTNVYAPGERGRRISGQQGWLFNAKNLSDTAAEAYGPQRRTFDNLREYLVVTGLDVDATGQLCPGRVEHTDADQRRLLTLPDPQEVRAVRGVDINRGKLRTALGRTLEEGGGEVEIPFPLTLPTGETLPESPYTPGKYMLPVLSASLRSGTELADGTMVTHDYTNRYTTILRDALRHELATSELESGSLSAKDAEAMQTVISQYQSSAQRSFSKLTNSIIERQFNGKGNIFKEGVMTTSSESSATAIWSPDPRKDIDAIGVSPRVADTMGLKDGDYVSVVRDPTLRTGAMRYMRVERDERLGQGGISINPVSVKSFDGDFDGDTVGISRYSGERSHAELLQHATVSANLLDKGVRDPDTGQYPLSLDTSLDVQVAMHHDPEIADRLEGLTDWANDIEADLEAGDITLDQATGSRREVTQELNDFFHDTLLVAPVAQAHLRFGDVTDHLASMDEACVQTGAKGSPGKLATFSRFLGVDPQTGKDHGEPLVDRSEQEGVQYAEGMKAHATGIAGAFSQRGVRALRNHAIDSVLEVTYPVTQSVLQAKHDPDQARHKYAMISGPAREFWRGRQMTRVSTPQGEVTWRPEKEGGRFVQAEPEQWAKDFADFMTHPQGLDVKINTDHVEKVAAALTDPTTGLMRDIEDDRDLDALAAPMDRLAYGGNFTMLRKMAERGENLYAGEMNQQFRPTVVRKNAEAQAAYDTELLASPFESQVGSAPRPEPELVTLGARDSAEDGPRRGSQRRSARASGRRAPRRLQVAAAPTTQNTDEMEI